MKIITRRGLKRLRNLLLAIVGLLVICYFVMIRMPGEAYREVLPVVTLEQRTLAELLQHDLEILAGEIGERNVYMPKEYAAAATFIETSLSDAGYAVERQMFSVNPHGGNRDEDAVECANISAEITGTAKPSEIVVVGAHYDSIYGSPGANDNGTGVVATLALARAFVGYAPGRTLRFVFFANEEPPFFQVEGQMGSLVYARGCRARDENIVAMISLETIGYYSDQKGSQKYPIPIGSMYPSQGDFLGFVSSVGSRGLLRKVIASFRANAEFPSEGAALPSWVPGVGWSDHWSFWQAGYKGIMVTDTAIFRYPNYHEGDDTPDKVDYERVARVTEGMGKVIERLVGK